MEISELNWSKRLLILSVKSKNDQILIKVNKYILENECKLNDRNIKLIVFKNFKNKQFKMPKFVKKKYGIWLLGYDGKIKDYSYDEKLLQGLFDLVDSMPMRKLERTNNID